MQEIINFMAENDMYAHFGDVVIVFCKETDEVLFIGSIAETLNYLAHYN